MSKDKFKDWIEKAARGALSTENLKEGLDFIVSQFVKKFPGSKIYFAEKLGKRISYISGAGRENYLEAEEIDAGNDYFVYLENIELNEREKEILISLIKLVVYIKDDKNES
ncbi:MAG: hypothetical protein ACOC21_01385 [Halanaerobiales bacterium]